MLDDHADVFRRVATFPRLAGHDVAIFRDTEKDPVRLAERLRDADVVVLTQQPTLGTGLHGRTLGVYAFGRIGSRVAEVGRAFGMRVLCWGRESAPARAATAARAARGSGADGRAGRRGASPVGAHERESGGSRACSTSASSS